MKILLIAGHGDGDSGAVGNGYKEAELTRELVKLVKSKLSKYATVDIADMSKNWYNFIIKLGRFFNFKPYDYVLEFHFNANKKDETGDGKNKGTEIYITTTEKNAVVEENILNNINSLGFTKRGVKRKNFSLIHYIKRQGVSSALLEMCFIDDIDDMKLYITNKNAVAEAITKGIAEGFGLSKEEEELTKEDVIKIIKEYEAEKEKEAVSSYFAESFNKATKKGIMDGTKPKATVSRDMLAEILNRLNLL